MSTPNVTPVVNPETIGDPNQAQPSTPNATPDSGDGGGGFLSHVGHILTNLGGKPPATYNVDDSGKTVAVQGEASPGQLFKNLLVGALHGMAAGSQLKGNPGFGAGLATGFVGAEQAQQTQDARARAQGQQDFTNKKTAQEAADKHTLQQVQLQHFTLENARLTHENDLQAKLAPLKLKEAEDSLQEHQLNLAKSAHDMGLTNGRVIDSYDQLSKQDADDIAAGKKVFVSKLNGSGTLYDLPGDPYQTNNTNPFEIATWGVGKDGKPERKVLGTVDAGKGTVAQQMAALTQENKTYSDTWGKYVDTKAKQAQTAEANAHTTVLTGQIQDQTQARQVSKDWAAAMQEAGNDIDKAKQVMQQKYPKSFGILSSQEASDFARNGETITKDENGEKTTIKRQRLFSTAPEKALTPQQQQGLLAQAKKDIAGGKTREQVQANLQAVLGNKTPGIMTWLDSQGAFTKPEVATSPVEDTGVTNFQ
jgi:hypothetical protein